MWYNWGVINLYDNPVLSGCKSLKVNRLGATHPHIAAEWHPTKNVVNIDQVTFGSKTKVWWLGKDCGHEWFMSPLSRTSGQGCAVCSGKQVQAGVNDLKTVYPELVKYWHTDKNGYRA